MSVKVSSWVWHGEETAEISGNEMILLLALADVADDNGRCRFVTEDDDLTYGGLAKKARVDRSTAIRVIGRLRARGLVEQVKGSRVRPNEFAIVVPWRRGGDSPPVGKVASEARKVASEARKVASEPSKGGIGDDHSSYRRIDVVTYTSEDADAPLRDDVKRLLDLLDAEIERNGGRPPKRTKKNIDAARMLLDRDGRTVEQVEAAIRWCQADEFWRANILSMSKLREKYETLRLQAARGSRLGAVDAGRRAAEIIAQSERLAVGS